MVFVTRTSDKVKQHTQVGVWLQTKPSTIFHFVSPLPPFIPIFHSTTFSFTVPDYRKTQTTEASKPCIRSSAASSTRSKYHQYLLGEPDPGPQHMPWPGCGWDIKSHHPRQQLLFLFLLNSNVFLSNRLQGLTEVMGRDTFH